MSIRSFGPGARISVWCATKLALCFWRDCYSGHVGAAEVRAGQIRAHQIGTLQACALETGTSETGILQLAATEICPVSLHAIEVPVPASQATFTKLASPAPSRASPCLMSVSADVARCGPPSDARFCCHGAAIQPKGLIAVSGDQASELQLLGSGGRI
jgi:hypothetical protein